MSLQIVKYGTKVILADSIKAFITGVCIREGESISYEVSYFYNGQNTTCWIKRFEFEIDTTEKQKAGFVNYDKPQDENNFTILLTDGKH